MCTAVSLNAKKHYFGRNLDWEHSFGQQICIAPRFFPFEFSRRHYAILGSALIKDGYPLFFDGVNEKGLCVAGLSFPTFAHYSLYADGFDNVPSYDFISWILSSCDSVEKAEIMLSRINICGINFKDMPPSPLHWIIADKKRCIVAEPRKDGIKLYDNRVGVLTNNPPFDFHLLELCKYMNLSQNEPENRFLPKISLDRYSKGFGCIGLPGDMSSPSRFVRCAFVKENSRFDNNDSLNISRFFHILQSVAQPEGAVKGDNGYEMTIYSSCIDADDKIYYYNTYHNHGICAVKMQNENLDGSSLYTFPMLSEIEIKEQN